MSNKLARYKDPEVLAFISKWFAEVHDNQFHREDRFVGLTDLYQSYHEYTMPIKCTAFRMDINMFAKCIVACKILDIGGRFRHVPTYEPAPSAITRATA